MTTKQRIIIASVVGSVIVIGYNLFLIKNGNTNRAVLDGLGPIFGMLLGYFLFGSKMNKKSE